MKKNIFLVGALALVLAACGNSADGYGGDIKLTVKMEGDTIKDITIDEEAETEGIGKDALPKLVEAAKAANSAEIDNESGATVTSEAFKSALTEAIKNAK